MSAWKLVAVDGLPTDHADPFFCWAPGWDKAMVVDSYPPSSLDGTPGGFCCSGGGIPEVTHYMPVTFPDIPSDSQGE